MKKKFFLLLLSILVGNLYADCSDLIKKYHAPDPSTKTMKQLKRWVKRKVKTADASKLQECLVARAADNPNKEAVAGE